MFIKMTNSKYLVILCVIICISTSVGQEISSRKCEEYADAVYVTQANPVMSVRSFALEKVSECGIVSVPLIIGGKKANEKEYPHMALLGFGTGNEIYWDCGGALISEQYVLTAAHCLISQQYGPVSFVKMGVINKQDTEDAQIIPVAERIYHPEYKLPSRYHDIALVKLSQPAEFNGYVRPACLNTKSNIAEEKLIASGFGKTAYSAAQGSDILMKVSLTVIPNDKCDGYFLSSERIRAMKQGVTETMLCAGELSGGKDTCQGDSGGPLQAVLSKPYCMYSLMGVTSFGKFCGFANSPAIYSRVSYYVPWIESIVWPEEL